MSGLGLLRLRSMIAAKKFAARVSIPLSGLGLLRPQELRNLLAAKKFVSIPLSGLGLLRRAAPSTSVALCAVFQSRCPGWVYCGADGRKFLQQKIRFQSRCPGWVYCGHRRNTGPHPRSSFNPVVRAGFTAARDKPGGMEDRTHVSIPLSGLGLLRPKTLAETMHSDADEVSIPLSGLGLLRRG